MAKKSSIEEPQFSQRGRPLAAASPPGLNPWYEKSWAVVIGINKYEDPDIRSLNHAVNDARGIAELLTGHLGFPEEQVFVILDPVPGDFNGWPHLAPKASKAEIEKLLLTELPALVKPDDRLLVFYAGHGERRPLANKEEGIGYLVPSDAKSGKWHTYVEMSALTQVLNLSAAKHIFYLLDCCYSGLANARGTPKVSDFTDVSLRNRALECLTAGTAQQAVDDDGPEGHSTFTWTVLQGLKKEADWNGDDVITGTDLMVYVKNRLIETYGKIQTPDFGYLQGHESGGDFIFRLPQLSARDYFQIATHLYDLGYKISDSERFHSALGYLERTRELSRNAGIPFPEAELLRGKVLLALGRPGEAENLLTMLTSGSHYPSESWFWLGLARVKTKNNAGAAEAFRQLLLADPSFEHAPWISHYIPWLGEESHSHKRALLIGINKYQMKEYHELQGCLNDVRLVKTALEKQFGFHADDIILLTDKAATTSAFIEAFRQLAARSSSRDTIIIHFSGHSVISVENPNPENINDTYLVTHDTYYDAGRRKVTGGISPHDLHNLLHDIPATSKTLILDTHPNSIFTQLAVPEKNYAVLNAAYPGEMTYEGHFELDGETVYAGLLSGAISETIALVSRENLSLGGLVEGVIKSIRRRGFEQNPWLLGNPDQFFCSREDQFLQLWDFSKQHTFSSLTDEFILNWYTRMRKVPALSAPCFLHVFGRAFAEKKMYARAATALKDALSSGDARSGALRLDLARVFSRLGAFGEAGIHLREFKNLNGPDALPDLTDQAANLLESLSKGRKHALLVGIDTYMNTEITPLRGSANDVDLMKDTLVKYGGFLPGDITLLINENATAMAILDAFGELTRLAKEEAALFYFSGYGSRNTEGGLTLLTYEGRANGNFDIGLDELVARIPSGPTSLVTILDTGWSTSPGLPEQYRTWRPDLRVIKMGGAGIRKKPHSGSGDGDNSDPPLIGCLTIFSQPPGRGTANPFDQSHDTATKKRKPSERSFPGLSGKKKSRILGELTYYLTEQIRETSGDNSFYQSWIGGMREKMESGVPEIVGTVTHEPPFIAHAAVSRILEMIRQLESLSIRPFISALQKMTERKEKDPALYLDLGLAFTAAGDWDKAIRYLKESVDLADELPEAEKAGLANGVPPEEVKWQAHYHLGRILFERKVELGKAVEELRRARELHPGDPRINFFFGQAIRAFVERETLAEATEALREYIDSGAPLGRNADIMDFIRSRTRTR